MMNSSIWDSFNWLYVRQTSVDHCNCICVLACVRAPRIYVGTGAKECSGKLFFSLSSFSFIGKL